MCVASAEIIMVVFTPVLHVCGFYSVMDPLWLEFKNATFQCCESSQSFTMYMHVYGVGWGCRTPCCLMCVPIVDILTICAYGCANTRMVNKLNQDKVLGWGAHAEKPKSDVRFSPSLWSPVTNLARERQ